MKSSRASGTLGLLCTNLVINFEIAKISTHLIVHVTSHILIHTKLYVLQIAKFNRHN